MSAKKAAPAKKKAAGKKPRTTEAKPKVASWLLGRLRNALHKTRPELKESKVLVGVTTLSELQQALAMTPREWEALLQRFFNLGGKLEE